ncbi:MAG: DUF2142 domain-containing protein [Clostridia bacterium]|nr:DUF2142 domain-containing protein [Clostridia bacterium]
MEKLKKVFKSKKTYIILSVIIYMLAILVYYDVKFDIFNKQYEVLQIIDHESNNETEFEYVNIKDSNEIGQKITIQQNNFSGFGISFNGKPNIKTLIGIKNLDTNEIIKQWELNDGELNKQNKKYFYFDKIEDSVNKNYYIYIKYDMIGENSSLPKYVTESNDSSNAELLIDNEIIQDKVLAIETLYQRQAILNLYNLLKFLLIITLIIVLILVVMIKNLNIEKLFLITIPVMSIIFLIIVPIGRNHDEIFHYKRAVEVSKGILITPIQDVQSGDPKGEWLNKVYQDIEIDAIKGNYTDVYNALKVKYGNNEVAFNAVFGAAQYSPVAYLPSALGILISRQFIEYPMISLYFGRMFNLIATLIMLYYSLKLLPKYKSIFYVIMLSPAFLTSISALSADGLTIGVAFLLISYILNISYNNKKNCTIVDLIIILLLGISLALLKTGYIPIIFLALIIPKQKFKKVWWKYLVFIIIAISILINVLWYLQTKNYAAIYTDDANMSSLNLLRIIQQPVEFIKAFIYTNINYLGRYLPEIFGSLFLRMV